VLGFEGKDNRIVAKASMSTDPSRPNVRFSTNIVKRVIKTSQSLILENAQEMADLDTANSIFEQNIRSAMCVPMRTKDKIIGAIYADASGAGLFSKTDLQLMTLLGNLSAIAVHNAQLIKENLQNERLAAVGQTVASLAHCIKNILQGLKGGAYMINDGIKNEDMGMILAAWPLVDVSQQKISELALNMLEYSKERKPDYTKNNLREPMKNIVDLMRQRAKEERVEVGFEVDETFPEVECDSLQIYRATLNLMTNAIDAAAEKEDGQVTLKLTFADDPDWVSIRVIDNGNGIPEKDAEKIFDAFQSGKGSKGTGLGLAVSQKIVAEHKGRIYVKSKPGQGSAFIIELPIIRPAS